MSDGGRAAALAEIGVSRETADRLDALMALLHKWNRAINLVGRSTLAEAWTRHVLDSAQLLDLAPAAARHWADLGSGGGFPGLVIAILAVEKAPDLRVSLVEADLRKAEFLRSAARTCGVPARVIAERIESVPPLGADVVSARALAPLPALLAHAARHLAHGGSALFPKGAGHEAEIAAALERWRFSVQKFPSRTDRDSVVLRIGDIARA
ncbi:MAG: 16S rRNA (guanine(527)-N(7))-methyltransferase RsmG [Rhodobacteraceae bacterium]|nr:16S rRNA (guanine(527)-N(7))-methyltransferase RsmG [Paracoccaceae bacterium]